MRSARSAGSRERRHWERSRGSTTRTIPAAVAWSLVGAAAIYIVFTWIADNAYPSAAALAAAPAPFVHLASVDVGSAMGKAVNIAGVISAFGAQLACINAANRLVFALGRDVGGSERLSRNFLTKTHPRFASPIGALVLTGGASVAGVAGLQLRADGDPGAHHHRRVRRLPDHRGLPAHRVAAIAWVWRHGRRTVPIVVLCVGVGSSATSSMTPLTRSRRRRSTGWYWPAGLATAIGVGVGLRAARAGPPCRHRHSFVRRGDPVEVVCAGGSA